MRLLYRWIIALILPLLLILTGLKLILHPAFLQFEYNRPGFPADPYGFTTSERMTFGTASLEYLTKEQPLTMLAELKFANGTPIYNARELSHMDDVQVLIVFWLRVWLALLLLFAIFALSGMWKRMRSDFFTGLRNGGWLTLGLLGIILASVIIDFYRFFTLFHKLFFSGDSWLFYDSDTLIRLFPLPFWRDGFLIVGGITVIGAIISIILGNWYLKTKRPAE